MSWIQASEVDALLGALRRVAAESEVVEAKSGRDGFPTSVRETLVAFANTHGGTVLIGVDELDDYAVVPVEDLASYRDRVVGIARDAITPPLSIATDLAEVDGGPVLVVQVPALPADQRPAYVTAKGVTGGAYVRTGDGDHRLGQAELALVVANRSQPVYDRSAVEGTRLDALDRAAVLRTLQRITASSPRLRDLDEVTLLHRLGVLSEPDDSAPLTLAGLLTFGQFPQEWFPQLMVSVVVHPNDSPAGVRFLDNETIRGPIPDMVAQAESAVRRNLKVRAQMGDLGRLDVPEIPAEIVREAIVNALLHRDYSPTTRGTQVAVNLYPDRLEVRSPGGIYGLSEDDLGQNGASSSRNMALAALLSDAYLPQSGELVAENRASGIPSMCRRAREHGLPLPTFRSTVTGFTVSIDREPLVGPETRAWIDRLGGPKLPGSEIALAMLRRGSLTEAGLRRWGLTRVQAGRVLRDLAAAGIAVEINDSRPSRFVLDPASEPQQEPAGRDARADAGDDRPLAAPTVRDDVTAAVRGRGGVTAAAIATQTGLSRPTVTKALRALVELGHLRAEGAPNSPRRSYTWIGPGSSVDHRPEGESS